MEITIIKALNVNGVNKLIINKGDIMEKVGVFKVIEKSGKEKEFPDLQSTKNYVETILIAKCPDLEEITFSQSPTGI